MQHCRDAAGAGEVPPPDRAAQQVAGVVAGQFGGAQQPGQGAALGVALVGQPVRGWQQRPDRALVSSCGVSAGEVGPHRCERGKAGRLV